MRISMTGQWLFYRSLPCCCVFNFCSYLFMVFCVLCCVCLVFVFYVLVCDYCGVVATLLRIVTSRYREMMYWLMMVVLWFVGG